MIKGSKKREIRRNKEDSIDKKKVFRVMVKKRKGRTEEIFRSFEKIEET